MVYQKSFPYIHRVSKSFCDALYSPLKYPPHTHKEKLVVFILPSIDIESCQRHWREKEGENKMISNPVKRSVFAVPSDNIKKTHVPKQCANI